MGRYQEIFRIQPFRLFWIGFTLSALGDVATRVALTWFVYEKTNSSAALGILSLTYTGPIIVSGLIVGSVLDRFDRRKVMIADNLFRGTIVTLIPLFNMLGILQLWHIYCVSLVYGSLVMISLAGSPALVPDLVEDDQLATANALETLSYTLSSVIGPLIAGFLIPIVHAPQVVLLDGASYFLFALFLMRMVIPPRKVKQPLPSESDEQPKPFRLIDSGRLLIHNPILLSTTLMFMSFNLGYGAAIVWLPVMAATTLNGGSELYGILLGMMAIGQLISSILVGTVNLRLSPGKLICLSQFLAGVSLSLILVRITVPVVMMSMMLLGVFSAPLTIWAQTLRMKIIPRELRGRTFALLRMLMQSTNPAGGIFGGFALSLLTLPVIVGLSAIMIGIPGMIGLQVRTLRRA